MKPTRACGDPGGGTGLGNLAIAASRCPLDLVRAPAPAPGRGFSLRHKKSATSVGGIEVAASLLRLLQTQKFHPSAPGGSLGDFPPTPRQHDKTSASRDQTRQSRTEDGRGNRCANRAGAAIRAQNIRHK